jgi:hypothetical protein
MVWFRQLYRLTSSYLIVNSYDVLKSWNQ